MDLTLSSTDIGMSSSWYLPNAEGVLAHGRVGCQFA
jgi:hypothetical protein